MVCSGGAQIAKKQVDLFMWILTRNIPEILGNTDRSAEHLLSVIINVFTAVGHAINKNKPRAVLILE
jgi:hypothetical protein